MPAGRPTDYTPDIGERILGIMSEGLSLAAAAAECDVGRSTVYQWKDRHPEFADTINLAMVKRQAFLERRLLKADVGAVVTSSIFALKNAAAEDWRDKREVELGGNVGVRKVDDLTDEELLAAMVNGGVGRDN